MNYAAVVMVSALGAALASVLGCVPGLHVYNLMGLMMMGVYGLAARQVVVAPELLTAFSAGLIAGYAVLNTVPSILLSAPDESAVFTVLPGQKYMMRGRGPDGIFLTTVGALGGLLVIVGVLAPLAPVVLPLARTVFQPHMPWILWCVISFMLMSEWPKGGTSGPAGWRRFVDGWRSTGAGLVTFLLSGLMGFVLFYRSPISTAAGFQNLMPAFVGLFAVPWLVLNMLSDVRLPRQKPVRASPCSWNVALRGTLAGVLGGGFAAFFPVVTGGVGGLLAGHATAQRDDRIFLVSQGASKLVYYVGAFVLFFVPGLNMTRGGGAWMLRGFTIPHSYREYDAALAAVCVGGAVALLMVMPLARGTLRLIGLTGYRRMSALAWLLVVGLVLGVTGLAGLGVMLAASCIGLFAVLMGARRMNCLGVILLPMACNMSGVGAAVARWLGLL